MANKNEIKQEAAGIVSAEYSAWQKPIAWVTDRVAFDIREVIQKARKNYWGVFDKPRDPQTGALKTFMPMTEFVCESTVKNIDRDQGNYGLKSQKPGRNRLSIFSTKFLQKNLTDMRFDMLLDDMERSLAIDGTVVWKIQEDPETNDPIVEKVDLLNFYIDPTAKSIKETSAVIERVLMTKNEVAAQKDWLDKDKINFEENEPREDGTPQSQTTGKTPLAEMFIREGLVSKILITGVESDREKQVLARIVTSHASGSFHTHYIEEIKKKSYEEVWLTRVPGRWYGRGQAEKVMMLQAYQNMIVNIRITRAKVGQLGLWKVRRNSGITPQMVSRLAVNGAIKVRNMDDIEQLVQKEASQASYTDESVAQTWAERVTNAFEVVTGESLPATQTATTTAVQSRSAQSNFTLIKKGIDDFVKRVIQDHLLTILNKKIKLGDVVRISLDGEDLREFDNQVAEAVAVTTNPEDFEAEKARILEKLQAGGSDRYVNILDKIDLTEYDLDVITRNSKVDESIIVTDLINLLGIAPQFADQLVPQILDVLGLNVKLPTNTVQQAAGPQGQIQAPTAGSPSPTTQLTQATTLEPQQGV